MSRKITFTLCIALFVAPWVVAADTTLLQEGFSADPGWETDQPENFYWKSGSSTLLAHIDNQPPEDPHYVPNRYIVTETDLDPTKSFRLTWDMRVNTIRRAGATVFGLYSEDLISGTRLRSGYPHIVSDSTINTQLTNYEGTLGYGANVVLSDGTREGDGSSGAAFAFEQRIWYEMGIEYNHASNTVRTWSNKKEGGEQYFDRTFQMDEGKSFDSDMRYIGVSAYPNGEPGTALGENSFRLSGHSDFEIDSVTLIQVEEEVEDPIDPLLLQYAPILYFHEDEDYFPMNVGSFIEDSALWSTEGLSDTLLRNDDELTVEEFNDIVANEDTSDYYLAYSDPDNDKSIDLENALEKYNEAVVSGEATTTVYVHKMTDGYTDSFGNTHSFIVLQYWFFYAMNNWEEHMGGLLTNNHEGDWESVFVFLDADTEIPKYVAYSSHLNDGNPEVTNLLQYDSIRRNWELVEKSGDRVNSFVALGSHANYHNNGLDGIHKIPLQEDDITSTNGEKIVSTLKIYLDLPAWTAFQGLWGTDSDRNGWSGPHGPKFIDVTGQARFFEPVEWAGLDNVEEVEIDEPTSMISFLEGSVSMSFSQPLSEGSTVSVDQHDEPITFGSNLENNDFLPHFWDFESNLDNDLPNTTVKLAYEPNELSELNIIENDLSVYYYNEAANTWEIQPSLVDTSSNTVTFTTDHFSRYAVGAPKWDTLTDGFEIKTHWGTYDPETGTRKAAVGLKGDVTGNVRLLITGITADGVSLVNNTGTTTDGEQFIGVTIVESRPFDAELIFNIPEKVSNGNGKSNKQVPSSLNFDYEIEVQKIY